MSVATQDKTRYVGQFDEVDRLPSGNCWKSVRQHGRRRFLELPFPSAKTEDWRFTNVAPLLQERFTLPASGEVDSKLLPPLPHADALRLTFVNGWFAPALSRLGDVGPARLGNLAEPTAVGDLECFLARIAGTDELIFTALNTSLFYDGAYLVIPPRAVIERPIEFLYLTRPGAENPDSQPRTLIVAGKNSQATIVERYLGLEGEGRPFTNAVTEIVLAEGAIVDHVKLQQENLRTFHVANTQIVLARGSNFTTHSVLLGGALVRNEVRVRFDDEGCEATVNGLYVANGTQHVDNHTVIDHARAHCNSHELYKGVLGGKAHGVFNGKIFVRKDAQKTDAKQTNKVLLLSDDATINTKPQLEIFADDVKCTHGATVGQLDEEQMYYLQSRGIGREDARRILTFAFANDIVGRIKLPAIREEIEEILVSE